MDKRSYKNENMQVPSLQAGFSIIHRHGKVMHDRAVKQYGLTGQQMGYLKYINDNKGISQEELAKAMQIDKGAVAKAVKDMCSKGYIRREQNSKDKRAYCIYPTEKAGEIAARGEIYVRELEIRLTEGMTTEEIEQFKTLLGKITENMAKLLERG